jgi:hypothetical protein
MFADLHCWGQVVLGEQRASPAGGRDGRREGGLPDLRGVRTLVRVIAPQNTQARRLRDSLPLAFAGGAAVGVLGGMIGLGGAEFRLPLLIMLFGFAALHAVIVNKALSLVVVLTALPARLATVPVSALTPHWGVVVNLLAGSLVGAWAGATWATRLRSATLYRVLAALLVLIAAALIGNHVGTLHHVALARSGRPASVVLDQGLEALHHRVIGSYQLSERRRIHGQQSGELPDHGGAWPVVDPGPAALGVDQAGLAQGAQVVGNRRPGQRERGGQVADADLALGC